MKYIYISLTAALLGCAGERDKEGSTSNMDNSSSEIVRNETQLLNLEQANNLSELPLACVGKEYPNRLGQTLGNANDLAEPSELHPAFFGCFDWHSAVHGHWSMIYLLKNYPDLDRAQEMKTYLENHLSALKIEQEVRYFEGEHNGSFERTYGWAWLLKLAEELHTWDDPLGKELYQNLMPLTQLLVDKYIEFLPKLNYPIRVGEHPNTAFGMSFAYEYALAVNDTSLQQLLASRARDFFLNDKNCPMNWEPGGYDFLSPCLEEMNLMRLVLPKEEFLIWAADFLPELRNEDYDLQVGQVSDRTDGKLVHLDGVNFSRAWNLYSLAHQYREYRHLKDQANKHLSYSLPNVVGDDYEGGHWLGSFALYALKSADR